MPSPYSIVLEPTSSGESNLDCAAFHVQVSKLILTPMDDDLNLGEWINIAAIL